MRYLLDTNAVIALLKSTGSPLALALRRHDVSDVGISSIVAHELYYGAFKSLRPVQNAALVDALQFTIVEFDKEDAIAAGRIRALLAVQGTPIGPCDVLIAGQALGRDLTLVTANTDEFSRVEGLKIVDWSR